MVATALFAGSMAHAAPATVMLTAASASDSFRAAERQLKDDKTALGEADAKFRSLYDSWSGNNSALRTEVAVPSIDPVDMERIRRSSGFGARRAPTAGASTNHKGVDLAGPIGTPIYATADGIIGRAQWVSGYGKYVEINHGNQIQTRYGHMSALNVEANQRVRKGDIIGFMGSTGRSTGSHLHYEVRVAGNAINPVAFMAAPEAQGSNNILLASNEADSLHDHGSGD